MNFKTVPFIVVCCYIIGELLKLILKKKTYKYIPILLSFIGGVVGLFIYLFTPNLSISNNIYDSILIGITSIYSLDLISSKHSLLFIPKGEYL